MTYKGYLIDLDGTTREGLYSEEKPSLELQKRQIPYLFVTNNSMRTPGVVQRAFCVISVNWKHLLRPIYTAHWRQLIT